MCRCDFLCSNAVVQFVWLGVCLLVLGGVGCFALWLGMGEAYVVVLRLGGGLHGEFSSKEVQSLLALAAMIPVSGCCQGSCYSAQWGHIVTPFHLKQWEIGLVRLVDRVFLACLCDGIRDGFRLVLGIARMFVEVWLAI